MRRVHIFGDSNVGALETAHKRRAVPESAAFQTEFYGRDGRNWIDFDLQEINGTFLVANSTLPDARPMSYAIDDRDALYLFTSPLYSGHTYFQPTWRWSCPWELIGANPDLQGVSTAVLETYLDTQLRRRLELLRRIKDAGYRLTVLEPPKPLQRTPALFRIRPDVLAWVDRSHRGYARTRLEEIGIPIISVPDDTHADGFTLNDYAHENPEDTHHANAAFGARMLTQLMQYAQDVGF